MAACSIALDRAPRLRRRNWFESVFLDSVFLDSEEAIPDDDAPFDDAQAIPGLIYGYWPDWPMAKLLHVFPEQVIGCRLARYPHGSGDYYEIKPNEVDARVDAFTHSDTVAPATKNSSPERPGIDTHGGVRAMTDTLTEEHKGL